MTIADLNRLTHCCPSSLVRLCNCRCLVNASRTQCSILDISLRCFPRAYGQARATFPSANISNWFPTRENAVLHLLDQENASWSLASLDSTRSLGESQPGSHEFCALKIPYHDLKTLARCAVGSAPTSRHWSISKTLLQYWETLQSAGTMHRVQYDLLEPRAYAAARSNTFDASLSKVVQLHPYPSIDPTTPSKPWHHRR